MEKRYEDSTNLYEEIVSELKEHNKNIEDIKFVCLNAPELSIKGFVFHKYQLETNEFLTIAKEIYYESGFGLCYINLTLKIAGDNWWLERHEYDGSEWWEFKTMPKIEDYSMLDNKKIMADIICNNDIYNIW